MKTMICTVEAGNCARSRVSGPFSRPLDEVRTAGHSQTRQTARMESMRPLIQLLWTALIGLAVSHVLAAQPRKVALPTVAEAKVPLYPPLARAANVQGKVRVRVTTVGRRVLMTSVENGLPLLAVAAEENLRTWQFASHEPISFIVTYTFKLVGNWKEQSDNPTVTMRLPTEVEVSTQVSPLMDNAH